MPHRINPEQRRRDLCDAAIELLGSEGSRGLSHPKVDRLAAVPAGTASVYYRTRKALLVAAAERINELDHRDLVQVSGLADTTDIDSVTTQMARIVIASTQPPRLTRTRAWYELTLLAAHVPELAHTTDQVKARFSALTHAALTRLHTGGPDPALIHDQNFAVLRFLGGVMLDSLPTGSSADDVDQIDRTIQAILSGIAGHHARHSTENAGPH